MPAPTKKSEVEQGTIEQDKSDAQYMADYRNPIAWARKRVDGALNASDQTPEHLRQTLIDVRSKFEEVLGSE